MKNDRTELELRKLQLEIREMERPIWRRPAFLGAFVPLMLALAGVASTVFTGYFDERMAALRDQRRELEKVIDNQKSEIEKKSAEIESREEELAGLEDSIRDYAEQVKISAEEREVGRLLHGIRYLYQECERRHPMRRDLPDLERLRARRDFYACLISRLEQKEAQK